MYGFDLITNLVTTIQKSKEVLTYICMYFPVNLQHILSNELKVQSFLKIELREQSFWKLTQPPKLLLHILSLLCNMTETQ